MKQEVNFKEVLEKSEEHINSIKTKRDSPTTHTTRNLVFGGGVLLSVMFAGMLALQLITGIIALVLTGVFGLAAFFVVKNFKKYDKLVAQKIKNHVLSEQLKEAQKNNIVQLKNTVLSRKERFKVGVENHNKMGGFVEKVKDSALKATDCDPYKEQKQRTYDRVSEAYTMNKARLKKAKIAIDDFEKKVYHYESMAEIAEYASMALASVEGNDLEDMLSLAAFDSIDTDFCEAMVGLENAVEFE